MVRGTLEAEGFAYYLAELRKSPVDPYAAYRVYEKSWNVPGKDAALVRRATIRLIEADPWFLATAMPHFLHSLTTRDLKRLTPFVGTGPARRAAPMLRATLWYHARRGPYHVDRAGRSQLRQALAFLQQVPTKQRDETWHRMLVGCYRVLDYARYKRALPKLLQLTAPNRRAAPLHEFLDVLAKRQDWRTYDRYRRDWDRLPRGHHACECYLNAVHTNDGLRAAAAGKWAAIPDSLDKAASVRGCPHLNSGSVRLDLAELLLAKRKHLQPVHKYLERVAVFEYSSDRVAKLRRRLVRIDNSGRHGARGPASSGHGSAHVV